MSRLYLIDDHVIVRMALRALLESAGHVVLGESDEPTHAIADCVRLQPDVVLLDLNLGHRSGFEILAELQQRKAPVRVIVLSMSERPEHLAEALRRGAMGYVLKGSDGPELLAAIANVAGGRRHLGATERELAERGLSSEQNDPDLLSPRERQILVFVARGQSSAAIAEQLHLSPKTVETYRSRLMTKLDLDDVPALVRWAIRHRLIDVDEP